LSVTLTHDALPRHEWFSWDGETVVYDDLSGETHRLDALATHVFAMAASSDRTMGALVSDVLTDLDVDARNEHVVAVRAAIAQLRGLGLIELADS
jgi:PqqD family protein of HPr-rel-A system